MYTIKKKNVDNTFRILNFFTLQRRNEGDVLTE